MATRRASSKARPGTRSDGETPESKYLPIRREAISIEDGVYRVTRWAAFEPNDEKLWSKLRSSVAAYMQQLFQQGGFQGADPSQAYFVKCDRETTSQADIDNGVVNIIVGYAPLEAAEFVILRIQQMAGQQDAREGGAARARGRSSLPKVEVTVDGRPWRRVASLSRSGPHDRVFMVETDDDGTAHLRFGDGTHGEGPSPSSVVTATLTSSYGRGGGQNGNSKAGWRFAYRVP